MKTAITSKGNSISSNIDSRFGRCNYFVIYDSETGSTEFIPNPYSDVEEGAGTESVKLMASRNVNRIISGEFGLKIKPLLDSLKIQMIVITNETKNIKGIITLMNSRQ